MLRHPSHRYVRYLLSQQSLKLADVPKRLQELHLPVPTSETALVRFLEELKTERAALVAPPGFNPLSPKLNEPTKQYLRRWELTDIWTRDPFMTQVTDILFMPNLRYSLEAYLLSPFSHRAIANRIRERFGLNEAAMNPRIVKLYAHYFWDSEAMNTAEWKELLWSFPDGGGDLIKVLLAPRSPAGAALCLAVIDKTSESLPQEVIYASMRNAGVQMFLEAQMLQRPGVSRTQSAFLAFQMVKGADEELAKIRGGSSALIDEFKRIEAIYADPEARRIDQVPMLISTGQAVIDTEGESTTKQEEPEEGDHNEPEQSSE